MYSRTLISLYFWIHFSHRRFLIFISNPDIKSRTCSNIFLGSSLMYCIKSVLFHQELESISVSFPEAVLPLFYPPVICIELMTRSSLLSLQLTVRHTTSHCSFSAVLLPLTAPSKNPNFPNSKSECLTSTGQELRCLNNRHSFRKV